MDGLNFSKYLINRDKTWPMDKLLKITFTTNPSDQDRLVVDTIADRTKLSKSIIKKLMNYGSVFQTIGKKRKRVRKAKSILKTDNYIECYYDPSIDLDQKFDFRCLYKNNRYGVYHKPMGALTEGNDLGDKISLARFVESEKRFAYVINRLDIHTEGLVVVAYDTKTQNLLQSMWRKDVVKKYQAVVLGQLEGEGEFDDEINKKFSLTQYKVIETDDQCSYLDLTMVTERKHQARIHLAKAGYPIMGDPKFGEHNKNRDGLELICYYIGFKDPYSQNDIEVYLPDKKLLF